MLIDVIDRNAPGYVNL